jgi:predicted ATPase
MQYINSFTFSQETIDNTNIYPYNILNKRAGQTLPFSRMTMLYGDNGCGKSTILNIIANKIGLPGHETPQLFGEIDYFSRYVQGCYVGIDDEWDAQNPRTGRFVPGRLIKSEDVLYEIKKIQQEGVLEDGYTYDLTRFGMTREEALKFQKKVNTDVQFKRIRFAQKKYSNGETALQVMENRISESGLYLLDEPEVSLSPKNQLRVAALIERAARSLSCQFIISTHSPFILGTLDGTIYDLSSTEITVRQWNELENVREQAMFFLDRQQQFSAM